MVLPAQIQREVNEMRGAGWMIKVNQVLPMISVSPPDGEGWFIQGDDASRLIEEAQSSGLSAELSVEDIILWSAAGW